MSGTVTIRRATPGDYEAICELAELMDQPQREVLPDRFRKPSGPTRLRDRTEKLMSDPDTFLAVAELELQLGRVDQKAAVHDHAPFPPPGRHIISLCPLSSRPSLS